MSENLVKRLREIANDPRTTYCQAEHWIEEAADEIERLTAEKDRLAAINTQSQSHAHIRRLEELNAALMDCYEICKYHVYNGYLVSRKDVEAVRHVEELEESRENHPGGGS